MVTTPRFGLTMMAASSLNKEVLFNEALVILDRMTAPAVVSATTTAPPGSPAIGDAYRVPPGATGAWAGKAQKIAVWTGEWRYVNGVPGLLIYAEDTDSYWRFLNTTSRFEETTTFILGMGDIPDVDTYGVQDGDVLVYDAGSGLWLPKPTSLSYIDISASSTLTSGMFDGGVVIRCSSASDIYLEIPSGLGARNTATIVRMGTGNVIVDTATGVNLLSADGHVHLRSRYSVASLLPDKTAETYILLGDISTP